MAAVRIIAAKTSHDGGTSSSASAGHAKTRAANQPSIDQDGIGPHDSDRLLRRRVRGEAVGQRRKTGIQCAPRRAQRLIRLQHHGEFGEVETADVN